MNLAMVVLKIEDGVMWVVVLNSIWDAVVDVEFDLKIGFDVVFGLLPTETSDIVVGTMLNWVNS